MSSLELHQEEDFVPGKYAEDARFGFLLLSGASFFVAMVVSLLDTWQSACFFMLAAIYFSLVYIALEDR